MTNSEIIKELQRIGAIKTGHFTLKSGATSPIYIDLRVLVSFPQTLRMIADKLWQKIAGLEPSLLCGVPYTALPIATYLSTSNDVPMVMRRKEKKDYGTKQLVEGVFNPGAECVVIEDVVTSGASILETITDLEAAGLRVPYVAAILDRQQGGRENLKAKGYSFFHLLTMQEIFIELKLPMAIQHA